MNKFDVKNFDPNKNYVIEASAGTGKTYNIVEIVDQLVNKYNEDLYKILIVTYTEKAAGELKSRIRDKIKGYDELYSDKECTKLFDDVVTSDLTLYVKTITQDQGSGCNSGMKLWTLFMLMSLLFVNLLKKNYNK